MAGGSPRGIESGGKREPRRSRLAGRRGEITRRQRRLENRAPAKAVLEARAEEREEAEQAEYEAKRREREEKAKHNQRRRGGKPPQPPQPGSRDKDPYHCTDPASRSMKNSPDDGFDPHSNLPVAVDPARLRMLAERLSNHPKAKGDAEPTLAALAPPLGPVAGAALDNGYFSPSPLDACEKRVAKRTLNLGRPFWPKPMNRHPTRPPPKSRWPTHFRRNRVVKAIDFATVRWNR